MTGGPRSAATLLALSTPAIVRIPMKAPRKAQDATKILPICLCSWRSERYPKNQESQIGRRWSCDGGMTRLM